MLMKIALYLSLLVIPSLAARIPLVRNAVFIPVSSSNSTIISNRTCTQCLCMNFSSSLLLNCFPNNTCQFFSNFPAKYKIQPMNNATLYFPQGIFPNASECCMPNMTLLSSKLKNATRTYGTVFAPRCLAIDNHGYLVTVSRSDSAIVRFNAEDMTRIDNTPGLFTDAFSFQYYQGNYYVGTLYDIVVINSTSLTVQNYITTANLDGTRDMMFLNNGNTLVVASTFNNYLLFFSRSEDSSSNYSFDYAQSVSNRNPHGFFPVTDTFFYTTSWNDNTVWSYTALPNTTQWDERVLFNASQTAPISAGNHIALDECRRWWFSLDDYGVQIFDHQGIFLDYMNMTNSSIFDAIVTENYILYLSDIPLNRIIRIDLNIDCS